VADPTVPKVCKVFQRSILVSDFDARQDKIEARLGWVGFISSGFKGISVSSERL